MVRKREKGTYCICGQRRSRSAGNVGPDQPAQADLDLPCPLKESVDTVNIRPNKALFRMRGLGGGDGHSLLAYGISAFVPV